MRALKRMPTDYAIIMHRKAREQGVDLLEGLPVTLSDLETSEYMPIEDYELVIHRFSNLQKEPDSGFRLGDLFSMANHGPLGFGAISAPTVRDGLMFLARYAETRTAYAKICLEYRHNDLHLVFRLDDIAAPLLVRHCETFSIIYQSFIESTGASAAQTTWRFPYPNPEPHGCPYYGTWLHGDYSFNADDLRLEAPQSVCMTQSAFRNDAAFKACAAQCEAVLTDEATDAPADQVRNILSNRIQRRIGEPVPTTQIPSAAEIAGQLKMSRRTLIRKLKESGATFQSIKDGLRRKHLVALLKDPRLSIAEIAQRLGYSEAANLTRACMMLFGETPRDLRAKLLRESKECKKA